MLLDTHTNLMWYPEHLSDEFVQYAWEAKKAKMNALTTSLKAMIELASKAGIARVGLPRIGAGPLGLEWPRVKKILSEVGQETTVTLVVFEQFIRNAATPPST